MSSNLDAGLVYRPPDTLQFPKGMEPSTAATVTDDSSRPDSPDSRAGSPDSSSSSQSDLSFSPTLRRDVPIPPLDASVLAAKLEIDESITVVNPETAMGTDSPILSAQSSLSGTSPGGGRFPKTPVSQSDSIYFTA